MTEFTEHDGSECPVHPNFAWATIEYETRGGYTIKGVSNGIGWKHLGKDGDVLRWRVSFPESQAVT